jgi:O-antigen ligase
MENDGPKIAFKLLLVFIITLYSTVAVVYKEQLDSIRPALIIAGTALFMMIIELGKSRRGFRLMWPQGVMLIAFLGVCVISSLDAIYVRYAVNQTVEFGKIVVVYILLENLVTSEKRLRTTMLTMLIGGLFPAIGIIYNYQSGVFVERVRAAWRGIFANPNEAAYALIVLIPLALALASKSRRLPRLAFWAVVGVYLAAIFLTFSRGGLIGLFAVLVLIGWKQQSIVIKAGMLAALLAGLLVVGMFWTRSGGSFKDISTDTTVRQRLATFQAGGLMFLNNPLLGVGPGDSMVAYPLYAPKQVNCGCQDQLVVHNTFIQVLAETGILGFIPFIILICSSLYYARKMEKGPLGAYAMALELSLFGFVVCSLSGGFTYTWWPYILIGLIAAAKRIHDSRTSEIAARGSHVL